MFYCFSDRAMDDLNFKIIHVPTENYIHNDEWELYKQQCISQLNQHIGFHGLTSHILSVKKSEDEAPEIAELLFQVQAKSSVNANCKKYYFYEELLRNWKTFNALTPLPIVVLYENSSFIRTRKMCHTDTHCISVAFGVLPHNGKYHQYASLDTDVRVDFFHDTRNMKIKYLNYELIVSYNNIRNIFVNIDLHRQIYFDLCNPPLVFKVENRRNRYESYVINHLTMTLPNYIDIDVFGRSNVIRLSLLTESIAEEIISMIHFRCNKKPVHYAHIVPVIMLKPYDVSTVLPSFGCTYLLTAMLKRNFTMAAQTTNISHSISELASLCLENEQCLEKALTTVLAALDSGKIINYWHAIKNQFRYHIENKDEVSYKHYVVPQKCRMIRRVTITPSRQLLWAPEIMFSNRVLRKFDSDYALRVSFRDDNFSKLSFQALYADENVFDLSVRQPAEKGIHIGLRHYKFLAWSNSQIRDHGVWMYATDAQLNTVQSIRAWMGDFSHIHSVPKYMARIGQCFSQTEDTVSVPLDEHHVRTEKDIEAGFDPTNFKPYCFSDGVGKISEKLAKEVSITFILLNENFIKSVSLMQCFYK